MTTPSPSAFDPQAFEGTAEYYAVGRPPYSAQLADTMARELSLDGTGQLLDVGCGPGVLELPLARLFEQVTALDPEPGMLQAGQRRCQQAGVANVRWLQGVAEDIAALGLGPQRAVTFGQSFHRVRRLEVAEAVYDLLVPGGALVLISHNADDGRPRPPGPGYPEVPRAAVQKLILDYLGDSTRQYLATWNQGQPARFEDTLSQTRFGGSRTVYAPGRPDLIRDIDTVVAGYFSLSYAAPRWFGNRRADFEADLRHLLREYSPDGLFWDWPGDTELVIATKSERIRRHVVTGAHTSLNALHAAVDATHRSMTRLGQPAENADGCHPDPRAEAGTLKNMNRSQIGGYTRLHRGVHGV